MKRMLTPGLILIALFGIAINTGCGQSYTRISNSDRRSHHGWLGVSVQDVDRKLSERKNLTVDHGAYVQSVVDESPADDAGIRKGDVIIKFDGKDIQSSDDLTSIVRKTAPHASIKIEIVRGTERKTTDETLERAPSATDYFFSFPGNGSWTMPKIPKIETFNLRTYTKQELHGLEVENLTRQLGEYFNAPNGRGILVTEVQEGSEADSAGFKAGDVITKVAQHSVRDVDALQDYLSDIEDNPVAIEIIRDGKPLTLQLHIERNDDDDDPSSSIIIPQIDRQSRLMHIEIPHVNRAMDRVSVKMRKMESKLKNEMRRIRYALPDDKKI